MGARDEFFQEHLARIKAAVLDGDTLASLPRWIERNTFLKGQPFSFKDHEFQRAILLDPSREKNVRKCSQVGMSEMAIRAALGLVNVLESSCAIYTLPTADFAKNFVKTRVDPTVSTSPALKQALNSTADNTQIKQFNRSFIHFKGTIGQAAAISVPADALIHDELDFSDTEIVSNYQSRLTHSPYKIKWKFSTPTVEGFGISAEMAVSRRYFNFVKCHCCGHQFLPDYFKHVRVPGYDGDLREIRKDNLFQINFREAFVECPKCGGRPSLQHEDREWVCENSDQHYVAAGYQVTPFEAPNIVTPGDLIVASTTYKRYVEFVNFGLGLPAEDKETALTRAELEACFLSDTQPGFWSHVMGVDLGMLCHIIISGVASDGRMMTVKTEIVPLPRIFDRMKELKKEFRVTMTVMDTLPYTETVIRLQKDDPNLFGAIYTNNSKDLRAFVVKKEEEVEEEAEVQVRQVNVNRNKALDGLMTFIRTGQWLVREDSNKETMIKHLLDMKRVKDMTVDDEVSYVWRKSPSGDDHFHHTLLYCWIASQMRGVADSLILLPGFVRKFKQKTGNV